jgi:hypothetical protein
MGHHEADETYLAIGHFMFEFSQLEMALRHFTALEAGVKDRYFNAVMTHDFSLLCTMAQELMGRSWKSSDKQKRFAEIIKQCRKMNDVRVRVAYGLWVPFKGGGTLHHVSRSSLKSQMSADQANELEERAKATNQLRFEFETLMGEQDQFTD